MVTRSAGAVERSEPAYRFDFCGGHPAIDFTNTVGNRGDEPEEHLHTYGDLLAWARARGVVSRGEASKLARRAQDDVDAAGRALRRAVDLRETLYALMSAVVDRKEPEKQLLARLNDYVSDTFGAAHLAVEEGRLSDADADRAIRHRAADVRRRRAHRALRRQRMCVAVLRHDAQRHAALVRHESLRQPEQGPPIQGGVMCPACPICPTCHRCCA
ncbi:MAG: hypothetical protein DMG00_07635 [Acidobacteria bacterium]|nr:MAG: hypothetical protein DMG00_07635 [Acidobacteriota bacterium]